MYLILLAVGILISSGAIAMALARSDRAASVLGSGGCVLGAVAALLPACATLAGWTFQPVNWPWQMPMGSFNMALDGLSALFVAPIAVLSGLSAIYGVAYLKRDSGNGRALRFHWFFYNLLVACMIVLVVARNGLLFLLAWEGMSLSSFFLVTFDHQDAAVRKAGWTYMVATHLGTAFLLVMFFLLGRSSNSLDFDKLSAGGSAGVIFLLAVIGFGTKAGFLPVHVWLPEAHPAAPSHVSAVMSGVMIKTGIYGLVRTLTLLGPLQQWWGWVLVGIGATSGIAGVVLALAQHDLKRLLAYHSVENIGIITMGLGLGVVGTATGNMPLAVLGFAGGLLHVVNHALFKGLLFLGAGAVLHATGIRQIDRIGGLIKKMPMTAALFLVGSAAICGLPPLNGFVSEFLIYVGSFGSVSAGGLAVVVPALAAIGALALIGGLAAACFAKAFGIVFLGEPRGEEVSHAHEAPAAMRWPMLILAGLCAAIGLLAPMAVRGLVAPVSAATGLSSEVVSSRLSWAGGLCINIVIGSGVFAAVLGGLFLLRRRLLAGREVGQAGTWDCGYIAPTSRMQYTASSFAQPLTEIFRLFLRTHTRLDAPEGLFPGESKLSTHTPDPFEQGMYRPGFAGVGWLMARLRWLQHGRLQLYVLYIALTLLVLLIWKLR